MNLTPYEITAQAENADNWKKQIDREFLKQDESHLWPVRGKFNATKRAIGRIKRAEKDGLCIESPLEYALTLDAEISSIVNGII